MPALYTMDVFTSLDGYGAARGDWTGYWGKKTPPFLEHRHAQYAQDQRLVLGAATYRSMTGVFAEGDNPDLHDAWVERMRELPITVISRTLEEPLGLPRAELAAGDAVEVVPRLKESSPVPLRSHGSLTMNRALLAAGLVDRLQVTIFPVITGRTGIDPILAGAEDLDLELLEAQTFEGGIQELVYRPTLHR